MKKLLLNFVLALVLVIPASVLIVPMASAAEEWPPSAKILGKTAEVLVNGVNNSGVINFENGEVSEAYRAKLVKVGTEPFASGDPANPAYRVEGWAWNDNLGWVSFYCDGTPANPVTGTPAVPGFNLGASCGERTYGVTLIYNESDNSFSFAGYAWNDATGYMSMGRRFNHPSEGGTSYYGLALKGGAIIDEYSRAGAAPYGRTNVHPYAWSNSLTWVDFYGVFAELKSIIIPEPTCDDTDYIGVCPDVCIETSTGEICNTDDGEDGDKDITDLHPAINPTYPVADGVDFYKITLTFKKEGNVAMTKTDLNDYDLKVFFKWQDTVKKDQVTETLSVASDFSTKKAPFTAGPGAITSKPVFLYNNDQSTGAFNGAPQTADPDNSDDVDGLTWVGDKLVLYVKSLAPTSKGNQSEVVSTKKYQENDIGRCLGTITSEGKCSGTVEKNNLKLESVSWTLKKKDGSGPLIQGTTPYNNGLNLDFRPALEVETLNTKSSDLKTQDSLVLYRNVPTTINVEGKKNTDQEVIVQGSINITFGISNNRSDENFKIQYKLNSIGSNTYLPTSPVITTIEPINFNTIAEIKEGKIAEYTDGLEIKSKIGYSILDLETFIRYPILHYSNHLPRTENSIANSVAVIQGTLYGTGTTTQTGVTITEVGDNNVNIVKDTVYENVKKVVRDRDIQPASEDVTIGSDLESCNNGCQIIPVDDQKILYIKGKNAIISNDTKWSGHKVIVVDGGNLFIDGNLYNGTSVSNKINSSNSLGLVVIRNTNEDLKNAGNIYIAPNVTNIQAFAVVWGAIFSYDGVVKTADKFAEYGSFTWGNDEANMTDTLNKQLIWQGGISSNNTIGGVDESDAYYKTGYRVLEKTDVNLFAARLYDLNYFRYFRKKIQYDEATGAPIDQSCGKPIVDSTTIPTGCDGTIDLNDMVIDTDNQAQGALDTETNPFYIKYIPPYSKSVIFSKEKSLTF